MSEDGISLNDIKLFGLVGLLGIVHSTPLRGEWRNGTDVPKYLPSSFEKNIISKIHDCAKLNYEKYSREGDSKRVEEALYTINWTSKYLSNGDSG